MKTGTMIRICGTALLLVGVELGGIAEPSHVKDAAGCSLSAGRPQRGRCSGDGVNECYECFYSDPSGEWTCYENIDGSIRYCSLTGGSGGPYTL